MDRWTDKSNAYCPFPTGGGDNKCKGVLMGLATGGKDWTPKLKLLQKLPNMPPNFNGLGLHHLPEILKNSWLTTKPLCCPS